MLKRPQKKKSHDDNRRIRQSIMVPCQNWGRRTDERENVWRGLVRLCVEKDEKGKKSRGSSD